jgi:Phage major capsid protein E
MASSWQSTGRAGPWELDDICDYFEENQEMTSCELCGLVSGASGFTADVIVMGKDAADAFEANANVMEGYNKLFIRQGTLNPSAVTVGVTALGTWRGIPLYASEEQYEDSDGTMKYYVPPKEVLVAASGIQSTMAYAAVAQVNSEGTGMEPIEGRRIPLVFWDTSGEDYRRFRLSSRPIPVPANTSSWTVLQVLA